MLVRLRSTWMDNEKEVLLHFLCSTVSHLWCWPLHRAPLAESYETDLPAQCMNRRTAAGRKRRQSSKEHKRGERERDGVREDPLRAAALVSSSHWWWLAAMSKAKKSNDAVSSSSLGHDKLKLIIHGSAGMCKYTNSLSLSHTQIPTWLIWVKDTQTHTHTALYHKILTVCI